ncbi:hypothetical protein, partial [Prosthecodimorpha hirschii]|uniref:hypothetical protein n=1 Tax=Prosthecodimorpha hirschii TaxID=665126 RepID=UPI001AEF2DB1
GTAPRATSGLPSLSAIDGGCISGGSIVRLCRTPSGTAGFADPAFESVRNARSCQTGATTICVPELAFDRNDIGASRRHVTSSILQICIF